MKHDFYCDEVFSGKTKVQPLYESEALLAYYHTKPHYDIHIVIVPRKHIDSLMALSISEQALISEIILAAKKIISDLGLEDKGARLIVNVGAYQDSPHLHFHLVSGKKRK